MKDNQGYLLDILEHVLNIEEFLKDVSESEFMDNKEKKQAVIRSFEVIGEVAKRVEIQFKDNHPSIPWKQMAGFRDILIHDYDKIVEEIIWDTAAYLLPKLKPELLKILDEQD